MAGTAGRYGYPTIANSDPMQGPTQISAAAAFWDTLNDETAATASALPAATERPIGHHIWVQDVDADYVTDGTQWIAGKLIIGGSVKRSAVAHTFSGSAWSLMTDDTYWTVDQPFAGGVTGPTTGKITVPVGGVYEVQAGLQFDATVTCVLAVKKNNTANTGAGAVVSASSTGLSGFTAASVSKCVRLAAGDYLLVGFYLSANAALTVTAETGYFSVRFVEPLR